MGGGPTDGGSGAPRQAPTAKKRPWWRTALEWVVGVGVLAGLVATCGYLGASCSAERREAAHVFFDDLREGRVEEAYGSLSAERRRALTLEAFREMAAHPVLAGHTAVAFNTDSSEWGPVGGRWHSCLWGDITYEGEDWYVEVYMTQRDDEPWRVQEWGVQEPRLVQETILDACRTSR